MMVIRGDAHALKNRQWYCLGPPPQKKKTCNYSVGAPLLENVFWVRTASQALGLFVI